MGGGIYVYVGIKISIIDTILTLFLCVCFFADCMCFDWSLGACYIGVLLINFVVDLLSLVSIESNSQSMGWTYAVLLAFAL